MFRLEDIDSLSAELNFIRDNTEKVVRLCAILQFISREPDLSESLVLKGGTAINLLVMPVPRLSVDIDLDFTGDYDRPSMLRKRKAITARIHSFMFVSGYRLMPRSKSPFSIDSWVFQYTNVIGNLDNIKIEINYSMRCHLLPVEKRPIQLEFFSGTKVGSLALVELYASKIKALYERGAARDLFDVHNMIVSGIIGGAQQPLLRKGVVFYAAVGGRESHSGHFSTETIASMQFRQIRTSLLPVLKKGTFYDLAAVKQSVCRYLDGLMKLTGSEQEFLERFNAHEYSPELLFDDMEIVGRIRNHPMALWKTQKITRMRT
ncbi:MAG: nucleotidyl transferase AbiEii/AbiGii toxin family protein [Bacteroidales bacterium]|nr:nucleotidyl transferase AbiEii/AbiGii toxin family protein [Bacteroidales bacterium]